MVVIIHVTRSPVLFLGDAHNTLDLGLSAYFILVLVLHKHKQATASRHTHIEQCEDST